MTIITFQVVFIAVCISLGLGPVGYWLARKSGLVDIPGSEPHKRHQFSVPIAGGIVLFLTVIVTYLIVQDIRSSSVISILLSSGVVFLFGLWDDIRSLSALVKFIGQLLASLVLIILGVQVHLFQQDWLNWGITLIWLVGITNAYNFVDSMDGLAIGLAAMASAFFMLVTFDSGQKDLSILSTALLGACVGVFFYNAAPAFFFLGDSGAQFLGFLLAGLGIAYNPVGFLMSQSWYVPILLVGVPIFDTILVVFSRFRRRKPVYRAGLDHTYHRLVAYGVDSNRAVISMHIAALLLGCLAFIGLSQPPILSNAIFGACILCGLILIAYLDNKKRWP